jgi:hypothetical protein
MLQRGGRPEAICVTGMKALDMAISVEVAIPIPFPDDDIVFPVVSMTTPNEAIPERSDQFQAWAVSPVPHFGK